MSIEPDSVFSEALAQWRMNLALPGDGLDLPGLTRYAYSLSEVFVPLATAQAGAFGLDISCKPGCGACCKHVVPLSAPEAFFLTETYLEPTNKSEGESGNKATVQDRFFENLERLDRTGFLEVALIDRASDYFALGLDCPFLQAGNCTIHQNRPLACREHLVHSDAKFCAEFPDSSIQPISMPVSIREALDRVMAILSEHAPEMIPMVRMQDWVQANRELRYRKWNAEYLLDLLVGNLSIPAWNPLERNSHDAGKQPFSAE